MATFGFGLRTRAAQNEASATLVEHLRGACPQLLPVEVTIEADPEKARAVFGLIGQKTPGDFAGLLKERVEQIPCTGGFHLSLTIGLAFYLSRNLRSIIPRVGPDDLRRNIEVQRVGFEQVTEV